MTEDNALFDSILKGKATAAREAAQQALAEGMEPIRMVQEIMIPAMAEVGRRFECSQFFVPELLLAARAMKAALELVQPLLASKGLKPAGRVVIGTVEGDLHDIGKNLVVTMLEGGGYEIIDLGVNVPAPQFVNKVREQQPDIVALSALLTTTMPAMKKTVEALTQAGLRSRVKVIVGGAPITQSYADEIGADGYAESASGAVVLARKVMNRA
jgi:5-methyltetrahydrofolate--homocysteine methyltransferase